MNHLDHHSPTVVILPAPLGQRKSLHELEHFLIEHGILWEPYCRNTVSHNYGTIVFGCTVYESDANWILLTGNSEWCALPISQRV